MQLAELQKNFKNVLAVQGEIPSDVPLGVSISINREVPLKIYGLGFQPAKSIPEISRWFLKKYLTKDCIVFEPFAGSGTTIIEVLKFGAAIYWLDYNPLSRLICRAKTTLFDVKKAEHALGYVIKRSYSQNSYKNTVDFANKDFWFQQPVIEALEILKENILVLDGDLQTLFWLAFSLTVRKVSDMNDSMILPSRRPNVSAIPVRSREDVFECFETYVYKALEAVNEWSYFLSGKLKAVKEIKENDSKRLGGDWKCDAIITSPPYINAIDYVWASKLELHWLGFVADDQDRLDLSSREIGTEKIPSIEYKELGRTGNSYLDGLIEKIFDGSAYKATKGQNQLRARVVYRYFEDMKKHFISCRGHLQKKGYYCFTIGDYSKICGIEIPVAELLRDMAVDVGFREVFRFNLILKNRKLNIPRNVKWAGTINQDTTIVLERI